jgi:hypothetical protein
MPKTIIPLPGQHVIDTFMHPSTPTNTKRNHASDSPNAASPFNRRSRINDSDDDDAPMIPTNNQPAPIEVVYVQDTADE